MNAPVQCALSFDQVAEILLSKRWIFAKTMPTIPHWYTLRREWGSDEKYFESVAHFVNTQGYREQFGRREFDRLDINEFKYWTMGAPLRETILINRAHRDRIEPYDRIADEYDTIWSGPEAEHENIEAMRYVDWKPGESVLDIGCGSGLALDYISPDRYVGLDPSRKMLEYVQGRKGFDAHAHDLVHSKFETFYTPEKFDLIISLFGSPNYIPPEAWPRMMAMLKPGGRYALMFYKAGYDVETHKHMRIVPKDYFYQDYPPGSKVEFAENYIIIRHPE